jgi:hypothetical protein
MDKKLWQRGLWRLKSRKRGEMESTMAELRRIYCKDGRWTELTQEHVQRQVLYIQC